MTEPTPIPSDTAQQIIEAVSRCMARHAVTRLQPREGREALILNDPTFGPASSELHLTWAYPTDQARLLKMAGAPGENPQAHLNEQAFYDDLIQTLLPLGAAGLRLLPGAVIEFRPVENEPEHLGFLFNNVRIIRAG